MDLWVVAVAAGAGYMGKYLQNMSLSEKERLLLSSSSTLSTQRSSESWKFLQQIRDRTCPLKRLAQEKYVLDVNHFGGDADSVSERASTSDKVRMVENINAQWIKNSPKFTAKESFPHNMEFSCRFCNSKLHKSRLSRAESIEKVEEYAHTLTMMPLLIADGNQLKESFNHNPFDSWSEVGEHSLRRRASHSSFDEKEDTSMRNMGSDESCTCFSASYADTMDYVEHRERETGSQERRLGGASHSPGHANDMLIFLIGLTIGMLPTAAANKREVQKMNEKLDQAMNLVQDLKEELDMKDNLTVKELVYDDSQSSSHVSHDAVVINHQILSPKQEPKDTSTKATKLVDYEEKLDNFLLMSRIEAELEAELERLQLNMDLERRSNFIELDTQSEEITVEGDMKQDAFRRQYDSNSESEWDERSDTMIRRVSTPVNDAVCPRELTIRLHEVIEARLEARIEVLETALQMSHSLESQTDSSLGLKYNEESPDIRRNLDQFSENAMDTVEDACGGITGKD